MLRSLNNGGDFTPGGGYHPLVLAVKSEKGVDITPCVEIYEKWGGFHPRGGYHPLVLIWPQSTGELVVVIVSTCGAEHHKCDDYSHCIIFTNTSVGKLKQNICMRRLLPFDGGYPLSLPTFPDVLVWNLYWWRALPFLGSPAVHTSLISPHSTSLDAGCASSR